MQARFLLGPAGSGKTFRCLAEIRSALAEAPDGPPLILLAPKQATFQIERQLLADDNLPGYTRLHILHFATLAEFVFERLDKPLPKLLGEQGHVMVLRALLAQRQNTLKLFRASARLPGFAQELSGVLREFQWYGLPPDRLEVAARAASDTNLGRKLHDLAVMLRAYRDWLDSHRLQDADSLLNLAVDELRNQSSLFASALWLDGFAEMTAQELALLAAVAPRCGRATLAFCLEREPMEEPSWLSTWSVVAQTFRRCAQQLQSVSGCDIVVEVLERRPGQGRFAGSPVLQHLESAWAEPRAEAASQQASRPAGLPACTPAGLHASPPLRLVTCANPEAEAVLAAREVLRFVRGGGRFRETAVLVRSLDRYHHLLRSVFTRCDIPFFLDRRESVAHHPLAELTRFALRTAAYGWKHDDWFGALKTGLVHSDESGIDELENAALEHGWHGDAWKSELKFPGETTPAARLERLRQQIVPPFAQFTEALAQSPTGPQLAAAIRDLWTGLRVTQTLERWSKTSLVNRISYIVNSPHPAVWEQMQEWLDHIALAFVTETQPLPDWVPVLETGLSGLTVGVIPPALDQVLIGAIDRSRNPDLRLALVLGLNETVFPAAPRSGVLLSEADRAALEGKAIYLGPSARQRLGHERYYGYIACTRARERLVLTCSARDMEGTTLNPSVFLAHLERLFPSLAVETAPASVDWTDAEHASELIGPLLRERVARSTPSREDHPLTRPSGTLSPSEGERDGVRGSQRFMERDGNSLRVSRSLAELEDLPAFEPVLQKWKTLVSARPRHLSAASAQNIHGPELTTSVSALEDFAECPFKFFVARGLRAGERRLFEVDRRERGSLQHEILKEFHASVQAEGRRWRDLTPNEARDRIGRIGENLLPRFRNGLFQATDADRFNAGILIKGLQKLMETLVTWNRQQYQFDPFLVEADFGFEGGALPAWRIPLSDGRALVLRGRIDRIDLCATAGPSEALAVVIDYKSSARQLDPVKLHHGLELQLFAYLGVLTRLAGPKVLFNVERLLPAGVFYVNLKGARGSGKTRAEALDDSGEQRRQGYQHRGRLNEMALAQFDSRGAARGDQFKYSRNKDGTLSKRGNEALAPDDFHGLLSESEGHLRRIGESIYAGVAEAAPFRKGNETACDYCEYRSICRFDPWVEPFRILRPPPKAMEPCAR
ncbi:MAG TPA: PD-(D/E)XK nuclease family protein [Verrucomicrobiae bacterium]